MPPNPPGNASSRERRAWAMSQVGRIPNPGPDPQAPASAAQMLMGRRQRRAAKLGLGLRGELATPERVTNCCDIGPTALALRASTSPSSYPNLYESNPSRARNGSSVYWSSTGAPGWQNWGWRPRSAPAVVEDDQFWHPWRYPPREANPGWLLGLGAGIVGAAAGAAANCYPRVVTQKTDINADGLETTLRISFAPCGRDASRYEAFIARRTVPITPASNPPWQRTPVLDRLRQLRQQEGAMAPPSTPVPLPTPGASTSDGVQMLGPVYFGSYIEALNWADAQTGISWRDLLTPPAPVAEAPQSNPGWMLGIGAGILGAAAGAYANCWPRVITQTTYTTPQGRRMSLRIRFAPCSSSQRFEAMVTPRPDSGMTAELAGPMYFRTYEDAIIWADEQSGLSWHDLLQPPIVGAVPRMAAVAAVNPAPSMRPARAGARANILAAANPGRQFQYSVQQSDLLRSNPGVWPPASAHSRFAPLPPQWFYYQSPSTAGAPPAPGVPVAAGGPPPGVWGRGNLCYADRDCGPDAYCHGGVCVRKPWSNPGPMPNPAQMQSMTVPLAPGFA